MPRHLAVGLAALVAVVFAAALLRSWLSVHWRLPLVEDLMRTLHREEVRKNQDYVSNNLQLMANRLGELQARVLQLDLLGERMSGLLGLPRDKAPDAPPGGQGGPFLPAGLNAELLQGEIERLEQHIERRADDLARLEAHLLEKRVADRLLPTALPVREATLSSGFGYRNDPFAGYRSRHEGIDFVAEAGTPVVAAADGVVLSAMAHPQFGNLVEIDHGDGLLTRYAHLQRIDVPPGRLLKRGERLGAVGSTGRSTGAHLHFEVRMLGVAQNPVRFLKRDQAFAQMLGR